MKLFYLVVLLVCSKYLEASLKYGDKRFNEWTWITAHNSNVNWEDSGVLPEISNQKFGVEKQLKYGVRGFMFDIDVKKCSAFEKWLNRCACEGVCLCHGPCDGSLLKDGFSIKPFTYYLKKIVSFLNKNPDEIVTIFLENYVSDSRTLLSIYNSVDNMQQLLFDVHDWNVPEVGWPKIDEMVKANKRLLIIDDEKRAYHADYLRGVTRSRDFAIQNRYEFTNEKYEWPLDNNNSTSNKTTQTIMMPRCFSLHNVFRQPMWEESKPLNLTSREHDGQPLNGHKLFIFNHFYGIQLLGAGLDPLTVKLVNTKDYILKRVNEKCNPGTNGIKPTHIALDHIGKFDSKNILSAFNPQ